jgi:hypothetical protein
MNFPLPPAAGLHERTAELIEQSRTLSKATRAEMKERNQEIGSIRQTSAKRNELLRRVNVAIARARRYLGE